MIITCLQLDPSIKNQHRPTYEIVILWTDVFCITSCIFVPGSRYLYLAIRQTLWMLMPTLSSDFKKFLLGYEKMIDFATMAMKSNILWTYLFCFIWYSTVATNTAVDISNKPKVRNSGHFLLLDSLISGIMKMSY